MSRFKSLVLAAIFGLAAQAHATTVPTRPDEVTVYPAGARVVRQGSAELGSGAQTAVFEGLPASLREESLRLKVEGPKGTLVYGLKMREVFSSEEQEKRMAALAEKIQVLDDERTDLTDRIAGYKAEADILKALGEKGATRAGNESGPKVAELAGAVRSVGQRLAELTAASRKAERAQRDLDKKLGALRNEQAQGGAAGRSFRVAEAEMELAQGGTCKFEISYFVDQASWSPRYDLRLRASEKEPKVELDFLAQVAQTSGESWDNVALSLSTARPTLDSQVPDPTNWWLDYQYQEALHYNSGIMGLRSSKAAAPMAAPAPADMGGGGGYEMEQAANVQAVVQDLGPATLFTVKRRVKIPSIGQGQRVAIDKSEHPADLKLVVVPRLSPAGFLEAKIHYTGESPLLPGPAQLFRDSDLAGQVQLPSTVPGETFDLGFGMDERVKATRKRRAQKEGSALLGLKGKRNYDFDLKISNFHEGERDIEVREQLPRSRQDSITVKALELDPKPLEEDPAKPGLLRWTLKLKKGEEKKLRLRYEVKWNDGQRVSGLE